MGAIKRPSGAAPGQGHQDPVPAPLGSGLAPLRWRAGAQARQITVVWDSRRIVPGRV